MSEHRCQCYVCTPDAFPPIPIEGERRYIAVQNPDTRPVPDWSLTLDGQPSYNYVPELNGEDVGKRCVQEACEGVVGWIVYEGHPHSPWWCRCGSGKNCQYVEYGNVQLSLGKVPS